MEINSDMHFAPEPEADIASEILARYQSSPADHHQHLCATVGAIAQSLKDQNLPQTLTAFFAAAKSSLDRLTQNRNSCSDPVTTSLLLLLSIVIPRVSVAVVKSTWDSVTGTVVRVLGFGMLPEIGVKAGLKCLAGLLKVGEKGSWEKVSPAFEVVLGFITDSRPKVRKQSHSSLYDILQSFKGSPAIILASEGITNVFERFLLLAGGSNSTMVSAEGPRGAMEVLYILNALRDCLSLMSTKYTTTIVKYCKPLVDLRQPILTRTIMEILQKFCANSTSEVASEVLLDLLCSLALCVAEKENLADEMTSTARLLHIGTKKAYDLNRKVCIVKLPLIFNALADILASEHEEAIFAATEALKGLMSSCIDEGLVTQGIEQIRLITNGGIRKSGPTIIEKICCTMEGLLGYRFNAVWDMSFQVLSMAFYQLGKSSSTLMGKSVKSLANLQKSPDDTFSFGKQLHECIGAAVGAIGPEIFLSLLPLNLDAEDISEANVWLLPILKQYTVGAHLKFFSQNILDMVRVVQQKSLNLEAEGRTFSARSAEGLVYQLWSLLPAFCNYPVDTSTSFKDLQEVICANLVQESGLHGIICSSLQILIHQNKSILEDNSIVLDDKLSDPERKAREHYTREVAEENLNAIRSFASNLLSNLSDVFLKSAKDSGGCLQSTIREVASISDKILVKKFFTKVMIRLLRVTEKASKGTRFKNSGVMEVDESNEASLSHARGLLLDLAVSLLPGVDKEGIDLLFTAIKSPLQDKDGLVQKKAYKTLATMFKESSDFLSSKLDELMSLMLEATDSCHFSAKRYRLDSLYYLIVYVSKDASDQRKRDSISAFLTEIILALKEANRKTRNRAYDLLVQIGHACGDEEQGGKKENLLNFFQMIAGGLAGEKPHMISAAVKGLARLAYEFTDLISAVYNLLPSSFLLLQRNNREIIKANLGLIKVLVAKSKAEGLQMHLRMMVEGLLKWQDGTKNHFKAKVKLLLEMLVRKCGMDAVRDVMPEEHMRLLTNIRKMKERKERKAKSEEDTESLHTKTSISRQSRWNHTRIFSDFGDDEGKDDDSDAENVGAKTVIGGRTKASIPVSRASMRSQRKLGASKSLTDDLLDQLGDEPLDLLDRQRTRAALQSSSHLKRKTQEDEDEPELDSEGRLVVREDGSYLRKSTLPTDHTPDARSHVGSRLPTKSQKKRQKTSESGWAYTGNEYRSRKAGGDLKKKDKVEPYAYWPLDRKLLNRRSERKASARKGMARVMKFAKRLEGKSASSLLLSGRGVHLKKKARGAQKKRKN